MPSLTQWAILSNPYSAPEVAAFVLVGIRHGQKVRTSRIVEVVSGDTVRTESGSTYVLVGPASGMSASMTWVAKCLEIQGKRESRK